MLCHDDAPLTGSRMRLHPFQFAALRGNPSVKSISQNSVNLNAPMFSRYIVMSEPRLHKYDRFCFLEISVIVITIPITSIKFWQKRNKRQLMLQLLLSRWTGSRSAELGTVNKLLLQKTESVRLTSLPRNILHVLWNAVC